MGSKHHLFGKKKQDSFEKWLGKYKVNLDLLLSESVRKCSKLGMLSEGHRNQLEKVPTCQIWDNLSNKIILIDYNPF